MHTIYPDICQDKASKDEVTEHLMVTSTHARGEQTTDAGGETGNQRWLLPPGGGYGKLQLVSGGGG